MGRRRAQSRGAGWCRTGPLGSHRLPCPVLPAEPPFSVTNPRFRANRSTSISRRRHSNNSTSACSSHDPTTPTPATPPHGSKTCPSRSALPVRKAPLPTADKERSAAGDLCRKDMRGVPGRLTNPTPDSGPGFTSVWRCTAHSRGGPDPRSTVTCPCRLPGDCGGRSHHRDHTAAAQRGVTLRPQQTAGDLALQAVHPPDQLQHFPLLPQWACVLSTVHWWCSKLLPPPECCWNALAGRVSSRSWADTGSRGQGRTGAQIGILPQHGAWRSCRRAVREKGVEVERADTREAAAKT